MAFEANRQSLPGGVYQQIDPTFMPGYPYPFEYHNMGQLKTPYEGKKMGKVGDYGPVQATNYYNVWNSNYPYPLDRDSRSTLYLPTEGACSCKNGARINGYFPCYNAQYPDFYIPPTQFFSPPISGLRLPTGHVQPLDQDGAHIYSGTVQQYPPGKEYYGNAPTDMNLYTRLRATFPALRNTNDFIREESSRLLPYQDRRR